MALVHQFPAIYVWNGTEWLLTLPLYQDRDWWYIRQAYYSANGSTWVT